MATTFKKCSSCKSELLTSEFHKNKSTKDGFQYQCRSCYEKSRKKYRQSETYLSTERLYSKTDKAKLCRLRFEKSEKGRAVRSAALKRYFQSKKGGEAVMRYLRGDKGKAKREAERQFAKTEEGRAESRLRVRKYSKTEKGRRACNAVKNRRNARKRAKSRIESSLTAAQWIEILDCYNHTCVYCGKSGLRLTQDHYFPLALGGSHTKSNVVPSCSPCNRKKSARHPHRLF